MTPLDWFAVFAVGFLLLVAGLLVADHANPQVLADRDDTERWIAELRDCTCPIPPPHGGTSGHPSCPVHRQETAV